MLGNYFINTTFFLKVRNAGFSEGKKKKKSEWLIDFSFRAHSFHVIEFIEILRLYSPKCG